MVCEFWSTQSDAQCGLHEMSHEHEGPSNSRPQYGDDVLLPWEKENLREPYRKFVNDKRGCCFNTAQAFPQIWRTFEVLDGIWGRELEDLEHLTNPDWLLPLLLLRSAHTKIRPGFELGFSRCPSEGCALLRIALESVASARNILRKPKLAEVWVKRNLDEKHQNNFRVHFENDRKKTLFTDKLGLDGLFPFWRQFSRFGSHAGIVDLVIRMNAEGEPMRKIDFRYLNPNREFLEILLARMLACSYALERVFFADFADRLELDPQLERMRRECSRGFHEAVNAVKRLERSQGAAVTAALDGCDPLT